MATVVYYNGVFLHNVTTRAFSQETVYDPSGTDRISTKFSLRFDGVIHIQTAFTHGHGRPPWIAESVAGPSPSTGDIASYSSASEAYIRVRKLLSQPRGALYVVTLEPLAPGETGVGNWTTLLSCFPTNTQFINHPDRDVSNGPKPRNLELTQLTGNNLFRISFSIDCEKSECLNIGEVPWVLNHRWGVAEDMDVNFFTSRTISGVLRLSGSGLADTINHNYALTPEWFRGIVIPPLELGFRRTNFDFAVSPDGMTANYSVTDKQVHTAAPWPATEIEMSHTEATNDGVTWFANVDIRLSGPPHIDKRYLIARLVQLADAKLGIMGPGFAKTWRLLQASITDNIGENNSVEGQWRIRRYPPVGLTVGGVVAKTIGVPLAVKPLATPGGPVLYAPNKSQLPMEAWGYNSSPASATEQVRSPAFLLLRQCYLLQDNCGDMHTLVGVSPSQRTPPTYPIIISEPTVTQIPYTPQPSERPPIGHSESHKAQIYLTASIENRYFTDQLRVQVPIATAPSSSSSPDADTCVIAQVGPPQAKREIIYDATRAEGWPLIPAPLDTINVGTLRGTLVHSSYAFQPPVPTAEGNGKDYHLRCRYVYLLNRPPRANERLNINKQAFMALPVGDEGVVVINSIIDPDMASGTPTIVLPPPSSTTPP